MNLIISVFIALGILPSLTSLSHEYQSRWNTLANFSGPLNILKFGAPFLVLYLWVRRNSFSSSATKLWGATLVALLLCSIPPFFGCNYLVSFLRETFSIGVGLLGAVALSILPLRAARNIITIWISLIFGSALLQLTVPALNDFLLNQVFDPATRALDDAEVGGGILAGIYGRQSLAKLMAWTPWLLAALQTSKTRYWLAVSLAVCSSGFVLLTSQRAPALAALAGAMIFCLHQYRRVGNQKIWKRIAVIALFSCVVALPLIPARAYRERIETWSTAAHAIEFRARMASLSLNLIANRPLGTACISDQVFKDYGLWGYDHSYNIFLEAFRSRGWIWGIWHLSLWVGALVIAWRTRTRSSAALLGGLTSSAICGLADHSWNVLNQSIVLWTLIVLAISQKFR